MPFYSASLIETVQVSYFFLFFFKIKNVVGIFSILCMSDSITEKFKTVSF